jgi:hypothetical protein
MVRAFLAKPLHFCLVAQPTKCRLPLGFAAPINAVAVFADPFQLGTPCWLWL